MPTALDTRDASILSGLAGSINGNLRRLRGRTPGEIERHLTVQLHEPTPARDPSERAARILQAALAGVDLHGCSTVISKGRENIRLLGSSMWLNIELDPSLRAYIEEGAKPRSGRSG